MTALTSRRHMLAAIFLAKSELGIADREWRDIVINITGQRNCADASNAELRRLLAALTRSDASAPSASEIPPDDGSKFRGLLAEIAALAGRDVAIRLARAKGGAEKVYIPTPERLYVDHWLVAATGWKAAIRIAQRFGPGRVNIPLGPAAFRRRPSRDALHQALAMGSSAAAAAHRAGVSERTARRHRLVRRAEKEGEVKGKPRVAVV